MNCVCLRIMSLGFFKHERSVPATTNFLAIPVRLVHSGRKPANILHRLANRFATMANMSPPHIVPCVPVRFRG